MKKYLFILIAFGLFCFGLQAAPAHAAGFTHVQGVGCSTGSGTSMTCSVSSTPAAGDMMAVAIQFDSGLSVSAVTVSDGNGNSYSIASSSPCSSGSTYLFYLSDVPSGASKNITANWTGTTDANMWVDEFSVASGTAEWDKDVCGRNTFAGSNINLPSITPSTSGELLYSTAFGDVITAPDAGATQGVWTGAAGGANSPSTQGDTEYDTSSTGATAPNYTDIITGDTVTVQTMAFKILPPVNCGETSQSGTDSGNGGWTFGTPCETGSNAEGYNVTQINYWVGTTASADFKLGVYSDTANAPSDLLCSADTGTITPATNSWNSISISGCPTLSASTQYWVGYLTNSDTIQQGTVSADCPGTSLESGFDGGGDSSLPNPITGLIFTSNCYSFYMVLDQNTNGGGGGGGGGTGTLVTGPGNIWVADTGGNRLEEFSATGTYESQFDVGYPINMAMDSSGNFWILAESYLEEYSPEGDQIGKFGGYGTGAGVFEAASGIAIDSNNNVWVSDNDGNRVEEFSATGTYEGQIGCAGSSACSVGTTNGTFNDPVNLAIDASGNVWVADSGNIRVEEFSAAGSYERQVGCSSGACTATSTAGGLSYPISVAIDASGNVWVGDYYNERMEEFSSTGTYIAQFSDSYVWYSAADPTTGHILISDTNDNEVRQYSATGTYLGAFGSAGSGNGEFSGPSGIVVTGVGTGHLVAGAGNILVADGENNRIEEFSASGTYEGQIGCSSGACSAGTGNGEFDNPIDVAVDVSGNVWVTDYGGNRVEEFSATGTYEGQIGCSSGACSAGTGNGEFSGPAGITIDASGNIWVTDFINSRVEKFSAAGAYEGQFGSFGFSNGEFDAPKGTAIDSGGNIWVTDSTNNRVEEFSATGTYEGQIGCSSGACSAGSGNGEFYAPVGIAIDASGNIWVSDFGNGRVEEFSATGTYEGQFGSPGLGDGQFNYQEYLAIDASGNIWVVDHHRVEEFSATGTYESQFGSDGTGNGDFNNPGGIAITGGVSSLVAAPGNIWVTDFNNNRAEEFSATGAYITQVQAYDGGGDMAWPNGVAIDSSGNAWVVDGGNDHVEEFSATGTYESYFGSPGDGAGELHTPWGIAIDPSGNFWVTDSNSRVEEFSATGTYMTQFSVSADGNGIAIDASGNIWVVGHQIHQVNEYSATGTLEHQIGTYDSSGSGNGEFDYPNGIAIDASGNVWVADSGNNRVEEFSSTGAYETQFGSSGSGNGEFSSPQDIAIDGNGNIWVADGDNNRVEEFSGAGVYEGQFGSYGTGNGEFNYPLGIAVPRGTTNISSASTQHWAWNDAIGWMDFYDTHNIIVSSAKLTGYASSPSGDISLDCGTSPNGNICGTSDYGVSNDGSGNLAGWAWNDAYGWISFCGTSSGGVSTLSGATWHCPTSPTYQVIINPTTGVFTGWAWNDTIGWISFNCSNTSGCGTSQYDVVTSWTASGSGTSTTGTLDSQTYDTGVSSGAQLNSVTWQGTAPSSTSVSFQFAVSASPTGPWNFAGPDGTSATSYPAVPGVPVALTDYPVLNGRYFRYQIILNTNANGTASPRVTGVVVNWSP